MSGHRSRRWPRSAVAAAIALSLLAACSPAPREAAPVDSGWEPGAERETTGDEIPSRMLESAGEAEGQTEPVASTPATQEPPVESVAEPAAQPVAPASGSTPESHRLAYEERRPKSVLELQPQRRVFSTNFATSQGEAGVASLVDLNPAIGAWLLLRIEWVGGGDPQVYHLENPFPGIQSVRLDTGTGTGLILDRDGERIACDLWGHAPHGVLAAARQEGRPFALLCDGWLYLRNATEGRRTTKEWASDFLRDRVWGGEKITTLVRDSVLKHGYRKKARVSSGRGILAPGAAGAPAPAALLEEADGRRIEPSGLGLSVEREPDGTMAPGRWYPVRGVPGVMISAIRPDMVAREIIEKQGSRINPLEPKEASALVYMVAFDLARLELGFALGTDHPRVNWSERAPEKVRDNSLPGPDGIGTVAPLVRTGMLGPAEAVRVVATFTGGFKRSHGAFKSSGLGMRNYGSHYGFIEQGVILSKLQPGLSTLAVFRDGGVTLGTWVSEADADSGLIRYARQNGVPILERDPVSMQTRPGNLVKSWGDGNWSGSADKKLRTLRAGVCLQEEPHGQFLIYGYFSSATPSAMARVFESYGCHDAMLLDMNALEHTYLAVYRAEGARKVVERLIDEMEVLDKVVGGETVPRFVGFPDNRDFFFLLARPES